MSRWVRNLCVVVILLLMLQVVCVTATQQLMYAPGQAEQASDFTVVTKDGLKLAVNVDYPLTHYNNTRYALFFHGNSGTIRHYQSFIDADTDHGFTVVSFDYRGYGMSDGSPSETGLLLDSCAVLEWMNRKFECCTSDILFHGFSMGCAAALQLAAHLQRLQDVPPRAILLEAPFASIKTAAAHSMPATRALYPLIPRYFNNEVLVSELDPVTPVAIAYTTFDEVCPYTDALSVFRASVAMHRFKEDSLQPKHFAQHAFQAYTWLRKWS